MLPQNGETPYFPLRALKLALAKDPSWLSWGCNSEGSLDITVLFSCSPWESLALGSSSPWGTTTWICLAPTAMGQPSHLLV